MFQYFSLFSQISVALVSIYFYKKYGHKKYYIFLLVFLCVTAIVESIGTYFLPTDFDIYFMSYSWALLQNILLLMFFYFLLKKQIIFYFFIFFIVMWVYFFGCQQDLNKIIILSFLNAAIFSLLYLKELLISDKIFFYKKLLPFWVSVGFLVFYLPSIPFFTLFKYMQNRGLFFIVNILIILMNLFIIYGLLCSNKEEKY